MICVKIFFIPSESFSNFDINQLHSKLCTNINSAQNQMNPENISKKGKFLCRCCAKPEDFNSDEVIFDYFGREFTEYEYVIENLAIRPAPKKLLDLVPVHSTVISNKSSISKGLITECPSEPSTFIMSHDLKQPVTGEGDFRKTVTHDLKIRDAPDDFISFRALADDSQIKTGENCIRKPSSSYYNNQYCQSADPRVIKDSKELRQTIRSKEYRTTKQILSDLYEASEQSLNFRQKTTKENNKPMSEEIKDTIETLKFKKPLPQFYTRTEKKLFHTPGVYFAEVKSEIQDDAKQDVKTTKKGNADSRNISNSTDAYPPIESFSNSRNYATDSTAQTEISKTCPCLKNKKNLKWKIIINKHTKCKRKCE